MGGGPAKELILFALPLDDAKEAIKKLHEKFPKYDVEFVKIPFFASAEVISNSVPADVWRRTTVLVTLRATPADPKEDSPNLAFVQLFSAGSNQLQNDPIYKDTDIPIATASGIHGPQISEWVILTGLVFSHKYNILHELQQRHEWGKHNDSASYREVRDAVGRRIGILGYGSIGRQLGRVAKAMGMQVLAFTATPKDTADKKKDHGFIVPGTGDPEGEYPIEWYSGLDKDSLHHFLAQDLDWLVVAVPLTPQTTHFLGKAEFNVISKNGKSPAFISNIARGPIINQPELITALKDGTLAGAALDVTDPEPLPSDNELWTLPNAIVTPHVSGVISNYTERAFQVLELNLKRRENGEKLVNVVRRDRGY